MIKRTILIAAVGALGLPTIANAQLTYNFDIDQASSPNTYSGVGVAPDIGTVWNSIAIPSGNGPVLFSSILDSAGNSSSLSVTIDRNNGDSLKVYSDSTASNGNPTPSALMSDYVFWDPWTVTVTGLDNGAYNLYAMGHGNAVGQTATFEVDAANGGGSASTTDDLADYRDIFQAGAEGNTYLVLPAVVTDGTLVFQSHNPNGGYINGFQIAAIPEPSTFALAGFGLLSLLFARRRS